MRPKWDDIPCWDLGEVKGAMYHRCSAIYNQHEDQIRAILTKELAKRGTPLPDVVEHLPTIYLLRLLGMEVT